MNYTDEQLKQALAKMLPNNISINDETLVWSSSSQYEHEVLETELLLLCWLAEKTLSLHERFECYKILEGLIWASWQQRVEALAKVKGIEI